MFLYICLYVHTRIHSCEIWRCWSAFTAWLVFMAHSRACSIFVRPFFGRNCVACCKCCTLTFSRCDERLGAGGGSPLEGSPAGGWALPAVPSRQLCSLLWQTRAPLWSVPELGVAYPTRQVSVEVVSEGRRRRGPAAGLCSSMASPARFWESLPRSGMWARSHELIPGQSRQGLCPPSLDIVSCLELYRRAWLF